MIDPNLVTTINVGSLPSQDITTSSLIAHELLGVLKKSTVEQLLQLLRPLVGKLQFEVVQLDVNTQYVIDNFDATGLGKNLCLGFAICNGQNGTKNRDGKISISYGVNYNFVGAFQGNTSHTLTESQLPIHSHLNGIADDVSALFVYGSTTVGMPGASSRTISSENLPRINQGITSQVGSNQSFSIMNPSIVTLTIMKL